MSVDISISGMQEKAEEKAKKAGRLGKRFALAALGVAGLAYDAGISVCKGAEEAFHKAEVRGEELESAIEAKTSKFQQQMTEEAKIKKSKAEEALSSLASGVGETGKAVENAFQEKLSALKIGDGAVLETEQITIEVEVESEVEDETAPPWDDYDSLNAQEIIDRLSNLDKSELRRAYDFEAANKNRVTVLREIELRLAAMEEEA